MTIYYTYKLTHSDTGQFYIGSRKTKESSAWRDLGIKYFSSSKEVAELGFHNFLIDVLSYYSSLEDCLIDEHRMIRESINNLKCLNIHYLTEDGARRWKHIGQGFKKGQPAWNSGKTDVYSLETLEKMKLSGKGKHTGSRNGMFGRNHTETAKLKMSIGHKGKPAWNKGIPRKLWSPNQ